ncbi:hypothetical protein [Neoroseomonas soli]|uniref:Uncharacterized protein n=1 Tax=Neoroseomonas soli TaxID=1081025 RepID=A0A9X9WTE5_9PROT|nr:hypothetical protein [Neoroseomonas soli]MBR0670424.1 hypothetical protein [Neoroseomonas soli]
MARFAEAGYALRGPAIALRARRAPDALDMAAIATRRIDDDTTRPHARLDAFTRAAVAACLASGRIESRLCAGRLQQLRR